MEINNEYKDALRVIKENNPQLVETIDKLCHAIVQPYGVLFPDEPDARIYGTHPQSQNNIMLFWRRSFFRPNNITIESSVPKGDRGDVRDTILGPSMGMSVNLMTGGQKCIELGEKTPQDIVFCIVNRDNPAHRREATLLPPLYSLAKSAGIQKVFDYTVREGPFSTTVTEVLI